MSAAEDLASAFAARLRAATLTVYDGDGAEPKYPYINTRPDAGPRAPDRVCEAPNVVTLTWNSVTVGLSLRQVQAARGRATDTLTGWRPALPGYVCHRVRHDGSQPVRKDDTVPDRDLWIGTDQWVLVAERATP